MDKYKLVLQKQGDNYYFDPIVLQPFMNVLILSSFQGEDVQPASNRETYDMVLRLIKSTSYFLFTCKNGKSFQSPVMANPARLGNDANYRQYHRTAIFKTLDEEYNFDICYEGDKFDLISLSSVVQFAALFARSFLLALRVNDEVDQIHLAPPGALALGLNFNVIENFKAPKRLQNYFDQIFSEQEKKWFDTNVLSLVSRSSLKSATPLFKRALSIMCVQVPFYTGLNIDAPGFPWASDIKTKFAQLVLGSIELMRPKDEQEFSDEERIKIENDLFNSSILWRFCTNQ